MGSCFNSWLIWIGIVVADNGACTFVCVVFCCYHSGVI